MPNAKPLPLPFYNHAPLPFYNSFIVMHHLPHIPTVNIVDFYLVRRGEYFFPSSEKQWKGHKREIRFKGNGKLNGQEPDTSRPITLISKVGIKIMIFLHEDLCLWPQLSTKFDLFHGQTYFLNFLIWFSDKL